MAEFVETGAVVIDGLVKGRLRRHLDAIDAGDVEGARAADMELRAGRGDQGLGTRDDISVRGRGRRRGERLRQAVALLDIEDGKALEEGNRSRLAPFRRRLFLFGLGREAVGIDDRDAPLPFPDMPAEQAEALLAAAIGSAPIRNWHATAQQSLSASRTPEPQVPGSRAIDGVTEIDEPDLERIILAFYARVRRDDLIGPIFNDAIIDWDHHLNLLTAFWSSVMRTSGRYKGNPVARHMLHAKRLTPAMFERWLRIWTSTTGEMLPEAHAQALQAKAARIAESLQLAILHASPLQKAMMERGSEG